ncbi:MAG: hypothetical protein V8T12_09540 [Parabacteroides johnsonii]
MPEEQKMPGIKINEYIRMYAPFYPAFSNETLTTCFESFEIDRSARLDRISQGKEESDHLTGLFNPYSVTFNGRTDQRAGHSLKRKSSGSCWFLLQARNRQSLSPPTKSVIWKA